MNGGPAPPGKSPNAICACLSSCPETPVLRLPEHMLKNTPPLFIYGPARGMRKCLSDGKACGTRLRPVESEQAFHSFT